MKKVNLSEIENSINTLVNELMKHNEVEIEGIEGLEKVDKTDEDAYIDFHKTDFDGQDIWVLHMGFYGHHSTFHGILDSDIIKVQSIDVSIYEIYPTMIEYMINAVKNI